MPAPVLPTANNLDPNLLGYELALQLQFLANLMGDVAAPTLEAINNYDPRRLGYEAIRQLQDFANKFEGTVIAKKDTQLTSTQFKALLATNIEVVPAPLAGFANVPVAAHLFLDHGGVNDFTQPAGTDHLALLYNGGAEITEIGAQAELTTFITASADAGLYVPFGSSLGAAPSGLVPVAAAAIDLDNNGTGEYAGNAADDITVSVRILYLTVPMAAFS